MRNFIESNIGRLLLFFGILLCIFIGAFKQCHGQTPQEVYDMCVELEIKHPEIVVKQSILETGWYGCEICSMDHNNIFGFRYKKEYLDFGHWRRSVYYYREWQIRKGYSGGDYYQFLKEVGYATDSIYIQKLKTIKLEIEK